MPDLKEREHLFKDNSPHMTGFTPRPIQQLAKRRRPRNMLDIECSHFLRSSLESFTHQHPAIQYQLWLEAGKHHPPFPVRPDPSYNSNVWRNFCQQYGFQTIVDGRKITAAIAAMYPLNIPSASKVGKHTFDKYIQETLLFKDGKFKALAVKQTRSDMREFQRLKQKSEARSPPLNQSGNILPPDNYKHYAHRFIPIPSPPPTPPPPGQKTDMFGQLYTPHSHPHLWKLSHKLNHPDYHRLQEEIAKRRKMAEEQERLKYTRVLPSPVNFEGVHVK